MFDDKVSDDRPGRKKLRFVINLPVGYDRCQFWTGHKGTILVTQKGMPTLTVDLQQGTVKVFDQE